MFSVEPSSKDKVVVDAKMDGQTVHNDNSAISTQVDQFRDSTSAVQQLKVSVTIVNIE